MQGARTKTAHNNTFEKEAKNSEQQIINKKISKQYFTDAPPELRTLKNLSKTPKVAIKKFGQQTMSKTLNNQMDKADFPGKKSPR